MAIDYTYAAIHKTKKDLTIKQLCCNVPGKSLYTNSDISITHGQKYGVIGRNGCGKSTLMYILKELYGDEAYSLKQFTHQGSNVSVYDAVVESDTEYKALEQRALELENVDEYTDDILVELQYVQDRLKEKTCARDATRILLGLGFTQTQINQPASQLSGGWTQRLSLAKALYSCPSVLLLDEPTNHLDYDGIMWLQDYLSQYKTTLVVVSHELSWLEGFCDTFIAVHSGVAKSFKKLESALSFMNLNMDIAFEFEESDYGVHKMAAIKMYDVSFGYSSDSLLFHDVDLNVDCKTRLVITGRNGCGKSTLIKIMGGILEPIKGRVEKDSRLRCLYIDQHSIAKLDTDISPYDFLKTSCPNAPDKSIHQAMSRFGVTKENRFKKLTALSGGEKARILYAYIALQQAHILLLDEPSNHLDLESTLALASALKQFPGGIVLVTHSMNLINSLEDSDGQHTKIIKLENGNVITL